MATSKCVRGGGEALAVWDNLLEAVPVLPNRVMPLEGTRWRQKGNCPSAPLCSVNKPAVRRQGLRIIRCVRILEIERLRAFPRSTAKKGAPEQCRMIKSPQPPLADDETEQPTSGSDHSSSGVPTDEDKAPGNDR